MTDFLPHQEQTTGGFVPIKRPANAYCTVVTGYAVMCGRELRNGCCPIHGTRPNALRGET